MSEYSEPLQELGESEREREKDMQRQTDNVSVNMAHQTLIKHFIKWITLEADWLMQYFMFGWLAWPH